jgi:hypothetical protein
MHDAVQGVHGENDSELLLAGRFIFATVISQLFDARFLLA